jgi:hypothetical protein
MKREELQSLLQQLRQGLAEAPPMDDGLRQTLMTLDEDIRRALLPADARGSATQASNDATLESRAQALEAHFEAEHPVVAGTLRDLIDRLGKMGI